MDEREKIFEGFIESYLISEEGGWAKATDAGLRSEESRGMNLDIATLTDFVKTPSPWRGGASSGCVPSTRCVSSISLLRTL